MVGGTLIDVTGKPAIPNSAVVIEGDRIRAAGPQSTIKIPNDAKVIDVTGKYLLPGLWDMHSHFYQAEFGPTYLAAGITTFNYDYEASLDAIDYHQYAGDFQATVNRYAAYEGRILFWKVTDMFLEPDVWQFEPAELAACMGEWERIRRMSFSI